MAYGVLISRFLPGGDALLGDQLAGIRTVGGVLNDYKINFPGTGVRDASGNYMLKWFPGSLIQPNVNQLAIASAVSGESVQLQSVGADEDVDLEIANKGQGVTYISGTGAFGLPAGTTAQRPLFLEGGLRYNSDTDLLEYFSSATVTWQSLGADVFTIINTSILTSYTLQLADAQNIVEMNVATPNTLIIPLNATVAFPIGTTIQITQLGAGATTVTAAVGVTIRSLGNKVILNGQYAGATIYKRALNEWVLIGNLA
ncbi:MAG: hypothetical protein [Caudoviricetes sp.]|nr:MAG: hypothetical protein [Caudoviricetes sp.]